MGEPSRSARESACKMNGQRLQLLKWTALERPPPVSTKVMSYTCHGVTVRPTAWCGTVNMHAQGCPGLLDVVQQSS